MTYEKALDIFNGKPYYSLDAYFKNTFNKKCYKIALNAHMTCPNRDGSLGTQGCIFCSYGGSGDFAVNMDSSSDIEAQINEGIKLFKNKNVGDSFIAYFQAYTNTYAPVSYLEIVYRKALDSNRISGISIATRPDCLPAPVLALLEKLKEEYSHKFIWVELGLQTIHKQTADYINRGYELSCFENAMCSLNKIGIPVIVHIILGLPGETDKMILETIHYLNTINPFGIKLQLLHVLKDTTLSIDFYNHKFNALTKDEYLTLLISCIENLSPEICIHRVTGDGPKELLIAPTWSLNKRDILNSLHRQMKEQGSFQGRALL